MSFTHFCRAQSLPPHSKKRISSTPSVLILATTIELCFVITPHCIASSRPSIFERLEMYLSLLRANSSTGSVGISFARIELALLDC